MKSVKSAKFGKRRLVFGASWTTLPGHSSQDSEVRAAAKTFGASKYVTIAREGSRPLVGFVDKTVGTERSYSAAAMIAIIEPEIRNAVYGFQFDDGLAAAICFVDGLPMIGFDVAGDKVTVQNRVAEFLVFMGGDASSIVFRGSESLFENCHELPDVTPFVFRGHDISEKDAKTACFKRASLPLVAVASLALFIGLSLAGWYMYENYQQEEINKRKRKLVDPNIAYEQSVIKALAESGYAAGKVVHALHPYFTNMPLFMGGWKFEEAVCQISSCRIGWVSDKLLPSTFQGFKSAVPPDWSIEYKSDFQSAATIMPLETKAAIGIRRDYLPKSEDFLVNMGSEVQRLKRLGIELQITTPSLFAVPPLPPEQPPITESALKNPVKEGTWSVQGPWWVLDFVQALPPSVTVSMVKLAKASNGINVQVEGKYYVTK